MGFNVYPKMTATEIKAMITGPDSVGEVVFYTKKAGAAYFIQKHVGDRADAMVEHYGYTKNDKGEVFDACVAVIEAHGGETFIKYLSEVEHPYYYDFPKEKMAMLSPVSYPGANGWRNKIAGREKIVAGSTITFGEELNFQGYGKFDTFKAMHIKGRSGRNVLAYFAMKDGVVRLRVSLASALKHYSYKVS